MALATPAFGANRQVEIAANRARKRAETDYLAMSYAAGAARLKRAAAACGADGCEPRTRAALVCDLATMLFRKGDKAGAARAWKIAVKIDPDVELNPAYEQPDVREAFRDATGRGETNTAATATAPGESVEGDGEKKAEKHAEKKTEEKAHPAREHGPFPRLWLGAAFGMDFMLLPSGNDVCRLNPALMGPDAAMPTDPNAMYCTSRDGTDFPPRSYPTGYNINGELVPGQAGGSNGGLQHADARLMFSADYAVTRNLLLGARVGLLFFTYPGQAAVYDGRASPYGRLHLEGRATWVFGENPLGTEGVAPLVFAGGGISEFDASTSSTVALTDGTTRGVDIWKTDGPGFVTAGGGVWWTLVQRFALTLAARMNLAFGNGAVWTFGPEVGLAYGF